MRKRLLYLQLALLAAIVGAFAWAGWHPPPVEVPYSELRELVAEGHVDRVLFDGGTVEAQLAAEQVVDPLRDPTTRVEAVAVPGDEALIALLDDHGVAYAATAPSAYGALVGGLIVPVLLFGGLLFVLSRVSKGGGAGGVAATFGRSRHKLAADDGERVTFDDVAGIDEAKEELQEVVQFLQTPGRFTALGGRIPKGVLLVGPPGTGKTLLAKAVAGEAEVPFFQLSGSDFVEMFVGVGAARVRDLFEEAQKQAPCIIFIDELDAIGKARGGAGPVGGHDEREQTLNQLLVEMDGFDARAGVILMGATNRPEVLDPALLRAGRFDRQVVVDRPDLKGRLAILEVHAKTVKLSDDVDLERLARTTAGFAGADLANLLNEGALLAARRGKSAVDHSDLFDAVERTIAGLERRTRRLGDRERRMVAFHEVGHAICAAACKGADPVRKVSIIPRGVGALGYTLQVPQEDRFLSSRGELLDRLTTLYGGRAAEELVFGDYTTGAGNDLARATEIARNMVTRYGMSERLGAVTWTSERQGPFGYTTPGEGPSAGTAVIIDEEIRAILEQTHERARGVLVDHMELVEAMSAELLEEEVLEGSTLEHFLARVRPADRVADHLMPLEVGA